jgi:hypothetical protein
MIAEAVGVFSFTCRPPSTARLAFAHALADGGVSATAQFILTSAAQEPGFGSLLNIA